MIDLSFYRSVLESVMYRGICTIQIRKPVKDPVTKKTENEIETVYEAVPCMLSHPSDFKGNKNVPRAEQDIELFISPDITVPANAKITVVQDGVAECYSLSGIPNRYPGHQELHLERWEKWA